MNLPDYLIACVLFVFISASDLLAQANQQCNEIRVEARIELQVSDPQNRSKITLDFTSADYKDFKLFLFANKRSDNRLDFTAKEINDLPKGKYTLIVQGKDENKYCPKQFNLRIN